MYQRILTAALSEPWAIQPAKLDAIMAFLEAKAAGVPVEPMAALPRPMDPDGDGVARVGSVAVIPVRGTLTPRANLMTHYSGGTSAEAITRAVRAAAADRAITGIVLDMDTPGGAVAGIPEAAAAIRAARGGAPIVAVANHLAASAGYWLASAADRIAVSPSGEVGSVGVVAVHRDYSAANARAGVRPTYITAGRHKAEGNADAPLSGEAAAYLQAKVDGWYQQFVTALASNRGISAALVEERFGQGRTFGPAEAIARGMADEQATLEEVVASLQRSTRARRPQVPV